MNQIMNIVTKKTKMIEPSEVCAGDTLILNGIEQTIDGKYIKHNNFYGTTINGMNIRGFVEIVLYPKWYQGKIIGYYSQI